QSRGTRLLQRSKRSPAGRPPAATRKRRRAPAARAESVAIARSTSAHRAKRAGGRWALNDEIASVVLAALTNDSAIASPIRRDVPGPAKLRLESDRDARARGGPQRPGGVELLVGRMVRHPCQVH